MCNKIMLGRQASPDTAADVLSHMTANYPAFDRVTKSRTSQTLTEGYHPRTHTPNPQPSNPNSEPSTLKLYAPYPQTLHPVPPFQEPHLPDPHGRFLPVPS